MLSNVAKDELLKIDALYKRWLVGGNAATLTAQCLPSSWACEDGERTEIQQRRMALILAVQQREWLLRQAPPANLQAKSALPSLTLPCLIDSLRPGFRTSLAHLKKQYFASTKHLLNLLLDRGYCAHPADWLPQVNDEVPAIYWPWCEWMANQHHSASNLQSEPLTKENWDDFFPMQRLALLRALRRSNAAEARELIAACAHKEAADKRLNIIEVLGINLHSDDQPYLESLINDRAKKIVTLSQQLLARLGVGSAKVEGVEQSQLAPELAQWFEVKKSGLLIKKIEVVPALLKSKKQQALRSEWLQVVSLSAFAQALGIELSILVKHWQFSQNRQHDNECFVGNAVANLSDEYIHLMIEQLLVALPHYPDGLGLLALFLPRVDQTYRSKIMLDLLANHKVQLSFADCMDYVNQPQLELDWQLVRKTQAWQALSVLISKQVKETNHIDEYTITRELMALGLLLPASCAREALSQILALGVVNVDPMLDMLKFNIQLSDLKPIYSN